MFPFFTVVVRFARAVAYSWRDPEFRGLLGLSGLLLLSGTLFYRQVEGWGLLDALYFSVVTLTTVGYGDLSPATPAGKVFTVFYIVAGVGIILGFVNKVAERPPGRRGEGRRPERGGDGAR